VILVELARSGVKSSLILGLGLACTAWAAESSNESQTVVVTANRMEEDIQAVPVDVSVVSGQLANALGITDLQSLAPFVPGLLANRQANSALPFIRGVGSPVGTIGDEPSVAFYVDDVYEPAASGALANFNSVDRIEVEKGPQGTVFGRNATGGVVQLFTRNPTGDPTMDVTVGVGNYNTQSAGFYAAGPLASTLSGNIALDAAQQRDGWGRNVVSGESIYTGWNYGGRLKLLWTPSPRTSALLNVDYDDTRTEEGINLRAWPGTSSLNPGGAGISSPAGYYDVNAIPGTHSITYQSGASLKLTYDFEWARLVNITAWRHTKAVEGIDEDPGIALANAILNAEERTWTEEIRLSSAQSSKSTWVAGLFFYHDVSGYDPLYLYGLAFLPLPYINTFGVQTTDSWAGFAQGKREIMTDTDLTVGVRYTADHRRLEASTQFASGPRTPAINSPQSATWTQPTYRAVLEHRFSDELMAYIAYNRGFKSGLFNTTVLPGSPIEPPVAPERVNAYTAGAKSDLLGRKLRLDFEWFYYDYRDIQVEQIVAGAVHVTNAAAAIIRGIDIDATIKPVPRFAIIASMEALSGQYTSFHNGQFYVYNARGGGNCLFSGPGSCSPGVYPPNYNASTGTWDLEGNHTIQTPPFSASLTLEKEIPSDLGTFRLTANWTHTGNYYADPDNGRGQVAPSSSNNDKQGLVNLLNASVSWSSWNERWQIQAWGKNLTGERYWSYATELAFVTQYSAAPPRTFGVTIGYHW
jgi:iron complex outermembrane recepter protein